MAAWRGLLADALLAFSPSQFLLIHVINFLTVTPHKLLSPLRSGQEGLGGRFEEVGKRPADLGETAIQEAAFQSPHPWSLQHIPQSNIQVQFGFKVLETRVYEAAELLKVFYCLTGNTPYSM
jgi:hypothetical protein